MRTLRCEGPPDDSLRGRWSVLRRRAVGRSPSRLRRPALRVDDRVRRHLGAFTALLPLHQPTIAHRHRLASSIALTRRRRAPASTRGLRNVARNRHDLPVQPGSRTISASASTAFTDLRTPGPLRQTGNLLEPGMPTRIVATPARPGSGGGVSAAALGEFGPNQFERVGGLVNEAEVAVDDVTVGMPGPSSGDQAVEMQRVVHRFGA